MDEDLDSLLSGALLVVPNDFTHRIMQALPRTPAPVPVRHTTLLDRLQALALVVGGMAGAAQLAAFMFGIWSVSTAG